MRISDWSSDVCSSDLQASWNGPAGSATVVWSKVSWLAAIATAAQAIARTWRCGASPRHRPILNTANTATPAAAASPPSTSRSEEHTSELQSLMRISYAVFCLKKNKNSKTRIRMTITQAITTNQPIDYL